MRSDLTAVEGVSEVQTDVGTNSCTFKVSPKLNLEETLKELAEENSKIADFEIVSGDESE